MDQAAFRELLSTPRAGGSSTSRSKFGAAKRTSGESKKETFKKPDFKPRDKGKKFKKKDGEGEGGGYRNRAEERRLGKDSDFAGVEKLLEDFNARSEGAEGADKQAIEEQMKYLGGDAEHSVLVKGLDMALLARMKDAQSRESDQTIDEVESELDLAFADKPKKRTRDEMVAELKASRGIAGGAKEVESEDALEKAKTAGRFKPIGFKPIGKASVKGKEKEVPEGEEKKRRKKKVKVVEAPVAAAPILPTPVAAPVVPPAALLPDNDDEFDIFGGAGEYKGLDSDSDDEVEPSTTALPPPPPLAASKRKYFDDEDDDEAMASTAPSSVRNLAAAQAAGEDGEEEESTEAKPMRLQGLSGSTAPSARDLLDMDAAAEKAEKRKAKKLKNRTEGGEKPEKVRTAEDEANHDWQVMSKHLEDTERRKNAPLEEEIGPGS